MGLIWVSLYLEAFTAALIFYNHKIGLYLGTPPPPVLELVILKAMYYTGYITAVYTPMDGSMTREKMIRAVITAAE